MTDAPFIETMLQKGKDAGERVRTEFSSVTSDQLNWKPGPDSWSIGQCLDHLIVADSLYFSTFKKIGNNEYTMSRWQKWSPLSGLFGKMLADQMQEKVKTKLRTTRVFFPSYSQLDNGIFDRFQLHLDNLLEYVAAFKTVDLDKTYISSPAGKFITYNLRDTVRILVPHLHRHINQAVRVKSNENYPAVSV